MRLYSFPGSCALATHIVLEWTGHPYTLELLTKEDLAGEKFRRLNPNGQVPVIEEDGWVLNENAAILNYLADIHPEAKLGGGDHAKGRAEVNRWMALINSDIHPTYKPLFGATAYLGDQAMIEKTQAEARRRLRSYFERIDARLAEHEWLAGERSIADPYLFVVLRWARAVGVDLDGLDHLKAFERRMHADPAVRKALREQKLEDAA